MIYLIRHGKTLANEKHLYCGSTDLSLTESGKEELKRLNYKVDSSCFVTSGMKRTNETLEVLFGKVPFEEDVRFREMDFGIFEMKSYEELEEEVSYQTWITGDFESNVAPGGESSVEMKSRVLEVFSELMQREENVVLVAHGGVIAAIMEFLFPEEDKHLYQWQPENGRGYAVDVENRGYVRV